MKVLLLNGSPDPKGCTFTALSEVAGALNACGIDTEIVHVGVRPISGCLDCGLCRQTRDGYCAINDGVNDFLDKAREADGFIFGSPVHYSAPSGQIVSFLHRCFFAASDAFRYKPGAAIVSCRRGGSTAAFEQLNQYFTISCMPVVSSQYWNMVHGNTPDEVRQDLEGMQIMRTLGRNMAWLLKSIEAGRAAGLPMPEREPGVATNFIR